MKIIVLVLIVCFPALAIAQKPCMVAELRNQTGYWTPGVPSAGYDLAASDLARQKVIVNNIIRPIQNRYTPKGIDIEYGGAYMSQSRFPDHIRAGNYYYAYFYWLQHDCPYNKANMKNKGGPYLMIYANDLGFTFERTFFVPAKPNEENAFVDAFTLIDEWPVQTDKGWYWKEGAGNQVNYRYVISREGKIPFARITKKEYAERQKEYFQKKIQQAEVVYAERLKSSEESYARLKKISEKDANTFKEQNKIQIEQERKINTAFYSRTLPQLDKFLQTADAKTLSEPAIVDHIKGSEEFSGFVEAGHINARWAVKPDPEYFNPQLPKSSPQFFTVHFYVYESAEGTIHQAAMNDFLKELDFNALKAMLGK